MPNRPEAIAHERDSCDHASTRFITETGTMAPGDDDVLMGRGKRSYNHEGNVRFRALVAERASSYFETQSKKVRRDIAKQIMARIEKNGGKFLRPTSTNDGWEITPNSIVLTKVKQALRDTASGLFNSAEQRGDGSEPRATAGPPLGNPSVASLPTLQSALYSGQMLPLINNENANLMALLQYPGISSAQCSLVLQALGRQNELEQQSLMEHRARQLSTLLSYQQLQQLPFMPSSLGQARQGSLGASVPFVPNSFPSIDYRSFPAPSSMANAAFENCRMQIPTTQMNEDLLRLLNNQGLPTAPPQQTRNGSQLPPSSSTKPDVSEDEAEVV